MANSGSVFSETLQNITSTKLEELSKRRKNFEASKSYVLNAIKTVADPVQRLELLSKGVKHCFAIQVDSLGHIQLPSQPRKQQILVTELSNLDRYLAQARHDPSVSAKTLDKWQTTLIGHLDTQSLKFQYASLYGQLVTEWLSGDQKGQGGGGGSSAATTSADGDTDMGGAFEDLGSAAKVEARMEWEKHVFNPPPSANAGRFQAYLVDLFEHRRSNEEEQELLSTAMQRLRNSVKRFAKEMAAPSQFDPKMLQWVIGGLLSSDLLPDKKREVLKDFKGNPTILAEVADVLNMRLAAIDSWSWGKEVLLQQRRQISGIFSVTMQEDVLQAIFLQYIGVRWSVFFKKAFGDFWEADGAWTPLGKQVPPEEKKKLEYYLGSVHTGGSLQNERSNMYKSRYFMAQLLDSNAQQNTVAEGEEEVEYGGMQAKKQKMQNMMVQRPPAMMQQSHAMMQQQQAMMQQQQAYARGPDRNTGAGRRFFSQADSDDDSGSDPGLNKGPDIDQSPIARKQRLLHLLSTEVAINTEIHGEITAFHSVFERWNPLLPHETILDAMRFFGVPKTWIGFFETFLAAPLKFTDDDASTPARQRRRGTPASHVLSDVFGESVFFCLDFAINQATSGQPLWRIYDDFWFWSPDHSKAVTAWKVVEEFAAATNTSINKSKTGSVRIAKDANVALPLDNSLPEGQIRWGFLYLSPETGRFEIDQALVDTHIGELRKQLGGNKSVFAFIQTWNSYAATFFTSNFGRPANCYGRKHVDNMLATHERIQKEIFSAAASAAASSHTVADGDKAKNSQNQPSSVVDFLKLTLQQRFGITDVPDGYFFFPVELGGLDLQSPFIHLLQIRDSVLESPTETLKLLAKSEREAYKRARDNFKRGAAGRKQHGYPSNAAADLQRAGIGMWRPDPAGEVDGFISFEDYVRYREELNMQHGHQIQNVFKVLMKVPEKEGVLLDTVKVEPALRRLGDVAGGRPSGSGSGSGSGIGIGEKESKCIHEKWNLMEAYWKWVACMYGPEVVERFGGLRIVDAGLLPMGMVSIFRDRRVTWEG